MFRGLLVTGASAVLIGLAACGGGDDGASVRNIGEPCPTSSEASGSATAASGSATGASGSASGTEC